MSGKDKKPFKLTLNIKPKISINKRWTIWRKIETNNRLVFINGELSRISLTSLYKNNTKIYKNIQLNNMYNHYLSNKLNEIDTRASISKQKNYCYYIGRSRSINRNLFMARHTFRKFARFGMLPGFIKERC
jgi:ribosomal protein S14